MTDADLGREHAKRLGVEPYEDQHLLLWYWTTDLPSPLGMLLDRGFGSQDAAYAALGRVISKIKQSLGEWREDDDKGASIQWMRDQLPDGLLIWPCLANGAIGVSLPHNHVEINTRGQFRRLCESLGITLAEGWPGK